MLKQSVRSPCPFTSSHTAQLKCFRGRIGLQQFQDNHRECCMVQKASRKEREPAQEQETHAEHSKTRDRASIAQALPVACASYLLHTLPSWADERHHGIFAIADIDAKTAGTIAAVLGPVLTIAILLMIVRIPLSWYPNLNLRKFPWVAVYVPTEPVLGPTRKAIPPVGGVDIAPIIWVAGLSFINEILLGPQGILNLLQRKMEL